MLTIKLWFFSLNFWSTGLSMQAMLVQLLVEFQRLLVYVSQALGNHFDLWLVGPKGGRCLHLFVPVSGPDPVGRSQARRPRQHGLAELNSECIAHQPQHPPRILLNLLRVQDGRDVAGLSVD